MMATSVSLLCPKTLKECARLLKEGKLVSFPTETVYGLGADATNKRAILRLFKVKNRPARNPLIVHIADFESARLHGHFPPVATRLAQAFWPGPLTLVVNRLADSPIVKEVSPNGDTIAFRAPAHPVAQALLRTCSIPLAAPSANLSTTISPTLAGHVLKGLGKDVDMILDGGTCQVGVESTVVDVREIPVVILRQGGIPQEEIEKCVPIASKPLNDTGTIRSPGMLGRHYAPAIPLRLNAAHKRQGEALLGFGPAPTEATLNLSPTGDLKEAAANLFVMLHRLNDKMYKAIAVSPIPEEGLGRAINDRLRRASVSLNE